MDDDGVARLSTSHDSNITSQNALVGLPFSSTSSSNHDHDESIIKGRACRGCKSHKTRCDMNRPKCLECSRVDRDCIYESGTKKQELKRVVLDNPEPALFCPNCYTTTMSAPRTYPAGDTSCDSCGSFLMLYAVNRSPHLRETSPEAPHRTPHATSTSSSSSSPRPIDSKVIIAATAASMPPAWDSPYLISAPSHLPPPYTRRDPSYNQDQRPSALSAIPRNARVGSGSRSGAGLALGPDAHDATDHSLSNFNVAMESMGFVSRPMILPLKLPCALCAMSGCSLFRGCNHCQNLESLPGIELREGCAEYTPILSTTLRHAFISDWNLLPLASSLIAEIPNAVTTENSASSLSSNPCCNAVYIAERQLDNDSLGLKRESLSLKRRISHRSGEPSNVYRARLWGKRVAVKILPHFTAFTSNSVSDILLGLTKLPAVSEISSTIAVLAGTPCIITRWFRNGNIRKYLRNHPDADRLSMIWSLADSLDEHEVHGSLTPENIMITRDGAPVFHETGLSIHLEEALQPSEVIGRPDRVRWVAPEILEGDPHTIKSDMYTFGCLVLFILTDQEPFLSANTSASVVRARLRKKKPSYGEYPKLLREPGILILLEECWADEPSNRPSPAEFVATYRKIITSEVSFLPILGSHRTVAQRSKLNSIAYNSKEVHAKPHFFQRLCPSCKEYPVFQSEDYCSRKCDDEAHGRRFVPPHRRVGGCSSPQLDTEFESDDFPRLAAPQSRYLDAKHRREVCLNCNYSEKAPGRDFCSRSCLTDAKRTLSQTGGRTQRLPLLLDSLQSDSKCANIKKPPEEPWRPRISRKQDLPEGPFSVQWPDYGH